MRYGTTARCQWIVLLALVAPACLDDDDDSRSSPTRREDAGVDQSDGRSGGASGRGSADAAGRNGRSTPRGPSGAAGRRGGAGDPDSDAGSPTATGGVGGSVAGGTGGDGAEAAGAGGAGAAGSGGSGAGGAGGGGEIRLDDAQIASVLLNANQGEISEATVAVARAQDAAVREYAQKLITEHQAALVRENALYADLTLAPSASELASQLANNSATRVADLQAVAVIDFDALYLRTALEQHQTLLDLIDKTLLPMAVQMGLRTELANLRTEVDRHIVQARQVAAGVDIATDAGVP